MFKINLTPTPNACRNAVEIYPPLKDPDLSGTRCAPQVVYYRTGVKFCFSNPEGDFAGANPTF